MVGIDKVCPARTKHKMSNQQHLVIINTVDYISNKYNAYRQRWAGAPVLAPAAKVGNKAQQDADKRAAAQHKREASAAEEVRVNALSPEDRKAHNRAVREARVIAKALREAGEVVALAGEERQ